MAIKPPRRRPIVTQQQGGGGQRRMAAGPARVPTVRAATPRAQATFQPTKIKMGVLPRDNQNIYGRQGYRQQSQKYPNAPGMPVDFNPNADLNTVQGNIDAGNIQWTPGLGKIGYKPPPRAPGNINIPGYHPPGMDISGDWEYQAALGDINAADAADAAAAGENINALAVNWGGDLSELLQGGLINQGAYDAAKSNQFSQMAELQRSLEQGGGRLENQLASRGGLDTGALVGGNALLNREYQQQTQTGLQDLMSKIRGIRSSQAQGAAERRGQLAGVRSSVASRLAADPMYQPIPDQQAFWDPSVQSYVDDWGRRYNRQGQRLS
jgi:hypothetical protein